MMRSRGLLIAVTVIVVLGLVAVWGLRRIAPSAETPGQPTPVADTGEGADVAAIPPSGADVPPTGADGTPPWALGLGNDPAAGTAPPQPASPDEARRAAQLAAMRQSMDALVADALDRSEANAVHVRKALDALEALDDPAVKAQIDLGAVRHNLEISVRMKALVRDLQQTVAQPRTPERQQRIDALQAEFQTLQGQLRADVTPSGATLPVPAMVPVPPAGVPATAPPGAPRGG